MALPVTCPHCGRRGKAPDDFAGKAVDCPKCHRSFRLAADPPLSVAVRETPTDAPGVISLILGVLSLLALPFGFCSLGLLFPFIFGAALIGLLAGCFAKGNLMVAGMMLNALALAPIVALLCASVTYQ